VENTGSEEILPCFLPDLSLSGDNAQNASTALPRAASGYPLLQPNKRHQDGSDLFIVSALQPATPGAGGTRPPAIIA
jgi:hypothetical protein